MNGLATSADLPVTQSSPGPYYDKESAADNTIKISVRDTKSKFIEPLKYHLYTKRHGKKIHTWQVARKDPGPGSDLPGGWGRFNPPSDFLTPRVSVDFSSWGVDSNPSVSVTC